VPPSPPQPAHRSPLATPPGAGRVLADELPGDRFRDLLLVTGYALVVGVAAQLTVTLPGTSVPASPRGFTVLLGAAVLGWRRALTGMLLYALGGLAGVPWFLRFTGGPDALLSETFGYVLGFVVAAMVVGGLAARGYDRSPPRAAGMVLLGSLIIYAFGLPWLMAVFLIGPGEGLSRAVLPFLPLTLVAVGLSAVLLPAAWTLARLRHRRR
jgi:biotin transport system substrate-specific component